MLIKLTIFISIFILYIILVEIYYRNFLCISLYFWFTQIISNVAVSIASHSESYLIIAMIYLMVLYLHSYKKIKTAEQSLCNKSIMNKLVKARNEYDQYTFKINEARNVYEQTDKNDVKALKLSKKLIKHYTKLQNEANDLIKLLETYEYTDVLTPEQRYSIITSPNYIN